MTPSDIRIAPLTQTLWNQSTLNGVACYNYYTPPFAAGNPNNYVSGCVSTALAQLMRYFQFPTGNIGTTSFSITVDSTNTTRQMRGGDGAGGPYVWANMVNSPTPTTTQAQAIGALIFDAGISSHMAYTASSSSATLADAKTALTSVFQYKNTIYTFSSGGLGSAVVGMVNPSLDAHLPVVLGITGTPGGHAVVCDGYGYSASTLYHHLNMGWSGMDNAWYALPTIPTGVGTFTAVTDCMYNIYTNGAGEIISGRVLDSAGKPVAGAAISAVRSSVTYSTTADANGIFALTRLPSRATYTITASKTGYTSASVSASTKLSSNFSLQSGDVWGLSLTLGIAPVTVSLAANPAQGGTLSGAGSFAPGTQVQISAADASGWSFYDWQDGIRTNSRSITVPASNVTYTASFVQPSTLSYSISSNSTVTLAIQGTPGAVNEIDYSTNLVQWSPLVTNLSNINGTVYFPDPGSTNFPRRFYRALIP